MVKSKLKEWEDITILEKGERGVKEKAGEHTQDQREK
jgi:hypothetical protein